MIPGLLKFEEEINNKNIAMADRRFKLSIQKFRFHQFLQDEKYDENILESINKSKVIIIDTYFTDENEYIIACFERQLIIIEKYHQKIIRTIFSKNNEDKVFFVPNANQKNNDFKEEIDNFMRHFQMSRRNNPLILSFFKIIQPCLSAFFIKKGYIENSKDIIDNFIENIERRNEQKIYKENEFISLRLIGISVSSVHLCYHIESEKIFAVKKFNKINSKLSKREIDNYNFINFPFLPKFYGQILNEDNESIVIDFINGQSLYNLDKNNLSLSQKLIIIIEILYTFLYLHKNNLVYRDLKLNNLSLDQNQHIVLYDFDRMIMKNQNINDQEMNLTCDLDSHFLAPELKEKPFILSFENDTYSIGKMIFYIFNSNLNIEYRSPYIEVLKIKYPQIYEVLKQCLNKDPAKRPALLELIKYFNELILNIVKNSESTISLLIIIYCSSITTDQKEKAFLYKIINTKYHLYSIDEIKKYYNENINSNNTYAHFIIGFLYYKGNYLNKDINKAIQYFSFAANRDDQISQYYLGKIYYNNKYIQQDINKAISYFSLAADKGHCKAQFFLGDIYYNEKYIPRNIDKSILYFTLAANQNHLEAQYAIALIYYKGEYVKQDIYKSIHFFTLAANQNDSQAQFILGYIYYFPKYVTRDINKSIHYFTLAANQNHLKAQLCLGYIFYHEYPHDIDKSIYYYLLAANQNDKKALTNLGVIYYAGKYVINNLKKSIYYFTLAANLNDVTAQIHLGNIYCNDQYPTYDINKSIFYLTLAANQGNEIALCNLGYIYYNGKHIKRDISKSIHYFTLSAKKNDIISQLFLGMIFYNGNYITRDINKSIYYLTLAANQNNIKAQNNLGYIYSEGKYFKPDIDKSIYYFSKAANQNSRDAYYNLGVLYCLNKNVKRDMNKSIYYFKIAAKLNLKESQLALAYIYYSGFYAKQDISKSIHYFQLAADQKEKEAQYYLGLIYYEGKYVKQDINKSLHFLISASKNQQHEAQLLLGDLYLIGKYAMQNIEMAIKLYKEVSSFNNQYAKNNLGVIYKNGFNAINQNNNYAKVYFNEAIKQHNDCASMFNLANILLNEEDITKKEHNKSISLLIESASLNFFISGVFVCLILFKQYKCINVKIVNDELKKHKKESNGLGNKLYQNFEYFCILNNLNDDNLLEEIYLFFRKIELIYINYEITLINNWDIKKYQLLEDRQWCKNINMQFYEGFGHDI